MSDSVRPFRQALDDAEKWRKAFWLERGDVAFMIGLIDPKAIKNEEDLMRYYVIKNRVSPPKKAD